MSSLEKFFSRILDAVRQCIAIVFVIVCVALGSAIAQPSFQVKDEMGRVIQPGSLIRGDSNLTITVDTDDKYLQVHASRQKRGAEIYFTERDLINEVTGAEYETELNLLEAGFVSRMDYATRITIGLSEVNYDVPPLVFPGEQAPSEKKLEPLVVQDFWIANPLPQMEVSIRVSEQDAGFQTVSFDLPQRVWRAGHRVPNVDPVFYLTLERLDRVTVDGARWVGGRAPLMDAFVSVGANAHQFIIPDIPGGYRVRLIGDGFLFGETTFEVKSDPMPTLGDDAPSPDEIPVTQRSVRFDDRDRVQNIEQSSVVSFRISNQKLDDWVGPAEGLSNVNIVKLPSGQTYDGCLSDSGELSALGALTESAPSYGEDLLIYNSGFVPLTPGQHQFALLGKYFESSEMNQGGLHPDARRPILDMATVYVQAPTKTGSYLSLSSSSQTDRYGDQNPTHAVSLSENLPDELQYGLTYRTIGLAARTSNGAFSPGLIGSPIPIAPGDIVHRRAGGRFQLLGAKVCDGELCEYELLEELILPPIPAYDIPFPASISPSIEEDSYAPIRSELLPLASLCGQSPAAPLDRSSPVTEYMPPAEIAIIVERADDPSGDSGRSLIGVKVINRGETPAADIALGMQIFNALAGRKRANVTVLSDMCVSKSKELLYCEFGDMASGQEQTVFFDIEVPVNEPVAWRSAVASTGDVAQPRRGDGVLEGSGLRIHAVLPISDQLGRTETFVHRSYPFENGNTGDDARYLLIVGEGLPKTRAEAEFSTTGDVFYHFAAHSSTEDLFYYPLLAKGWSRYYGEGDTKEALKRATEDGLEAILVDARLQAPALPGPRAVTLNGQSDIWELRYGDLAYSVSFLRHVRGVGYEQTTTAIVPERLRLMVKLSHKLPLDAIPVTFGVFDTNQNSRRVEKVFLGRATALGDNVYMSEPLDFHRFGQTASSLGGRPIEAKLDRDNPEIVFASIDPSFKDAKLATTYGHQTAELNLKSAPIYENKTYLWTDALSRAAQCKPDLKTVNWRAMTTQEADEFWNIVVLTDSPIYRSLSFKIGHHASAILLRDKFIEVMEKRRTQLIWARNNRSGIFEMIRSLEPLSSLQNHPFFDFEVEDFDGSNTKVKYALTLSREFLMEAWEASEEDIDVWRVKAMRSAIDQMIDAMDESIADAKGVEDCDPDDLLDLAGYGFKAIERELVPSMMRLTDVVSPNGARHQLWVPDYQARRWIPQLESFAEAVEAQEAFADMDTVELSLLFSMFTAGASGLFEFYGLATAHSVLVAVEGTELAVTTTIEARKFLKGRDELDFALGTREVLGDRRYLRARAEAGSWLQGVGIVSLSSVFFGIDVAQIVKYRRIGRGVEIAKQLDELGGLQALSETQKRDYLEFAAYARVKSQTRGADKLSSLERQTIRKFEGTDGPDIEVVFGPYGANPADDIDFSASNIDSRPNPNEAFSNVPNSFESRVRDGKLSFEQPNGSVSEIQVGERLGFGSTSEVFAHPTIKDAVIRVTYVREGAAAQKLDSFGEDVLNNSLNSEHIRAARVIEEYPIKEGGGITRVAVVEKLEEIASVTLAKRADELMVAARRGKSVPGPRQIKLRGAEAVAYTEAIADLNRRGFVWLDNKSNNFAFVRSQDGSGRVQIVVFDTGGIVPVRQAVADFRGITVEELAREIQFRVNGDFNLAIPSRTDAVRAEARSMYRREFILKEYGDVLDWREVQLNSPSELWFNPWAGEEFADLNRLFETPPSLASRSTSTSFDTVIFETFDPPPSCPVRELTERPTNPFDEILVSPTETARPGALNSIGLDSPLSDSTGTVRINPGATPPPSTGPPQVGVNALFVLQPNGDRVLFRFRERALGQGSYNTAFLVEEGWVLRMPGGRFDRPSAKNIQIDRGGRQIFIDTIGEEGQNVRLIELREELIIAQDGLVLTKRSDLSPAVELLRGDIVQVVKFRRPFSAEFSDPELLSLRGNAYKSAMTPEEALAFDRAHRELNQNGLVWLDNKWDNFAFEPHPNPSFPGELRLVILDSGGIVAMKGRDVAKAERLQRYVNGAGSKAFREQYEKLPLTAGQFDIRYPMKRDLIVEEFGDQVDVRGLGIDSDDLDDVGFLPIAAEEFPAARALSAMNRPGAEDFYKQFVQHRKSGSIIEMPCIGE